MLLSRLLRRAGRPRVSGALALKEASKPYLARTQDLKPCWRLVRGRWFRWSVCIFRVRPLMSLQGSATRSKDSQEPGRNKGKEQPDSDPSRRVLRGHLGQDLQFQAWATFGAQKGGPASGNVSRGGGGGGRCFSFRWFRGNIFGGSELLPGEPPPPPPSQAL